ncbi:MAG: asparagine--tRNA ligase [Candidatus Micrarchaeota archaeon]|nr:asparagine--tRNA ligase [Candidatus Micrarchaeota archaeon]
MTEFTQIGKILSGKYVGRDVSVRGWIYRKRSSGGVQFLVLRDSTGTMQVAIKKENVPEKAYHDADKALIESAVTAKGVVKEDGRAPGGYELQVTEFSVISFSEPFPITEHQSTELLLDLRHLWLRSQKLTNIMKVRQYLVNYLREYFFSQGFWEVAPPIITQAGCEGGSTLFEFKYFDDTAYLSQSAQLYNEVFITALEKIFVLAPSFRAEKSRTVKHLAEYWHLEAEEAFYHNEDNMKLQEELVSYACQKLAKNHADLLEFFKVKPETLAKVSPPFKRISYDDAIDFLVKKGIKKTWGDDFGTEDEEILTSGIEKPMFIYNYPKGGRAFYMKVNPENPKTVLNADMQAPNGHGELAGGSERIWEYDELMKRIKEEKLDVKSYQWYIDLRKYGSVPHSGFGLGIERLLKWVLNLDHIRDAVPFPRTINRVYP